MKVFKVLFTAVAAVMFMASATAQDAPSVADVATKYNEAAALVTSGKYAEAIPALNSAIELGLKAGPDAMTTVNDAQKLLPACYFRKGLGDVKAGKFEEAIGDLTKAVELGELYGDMSSMNNAKSVISKVYSMMAANAFNSKDYAKAAEIFSKGFAANPNDTELGLNLAMSYCEMGDMEKGIEVYKSIIALEDRHSKYKEPAAAAKEKLAYYLLLDAAKAGKEGNNDRLFSIVDEVLAVNPASSEANMMRIQTATNLKNWDMVIANGDAAADAQTDANLKSEAYFLLGAAYQNKENKAKAIETYKKVVAGTKVALAKQQIAALSK